jgi:hypothetical protein
MTTRRSSDDAERVQPVVDRITVALIRRAGEDLQKLQDRTGLSKTDLVNRAISLYEFIGAQQHAGSDVLLHDPNSGDTRRVILL